MTTDVAQTCSIPIRKMEMLGAELRLLKGAIEQVHGRFELLLAEMADLQHEHQVSNEPSAPEILPPSLTEEPDTAPLPASSILDASSHELDLAACNTHEASAVEPIISIADPLPAIDAKEIIVEAIPAIAPEQAQDNDTPVPETPRSEETELHEPLAPEIAPLTVAVAEPTTEAAATIPALPQSEACEIIVLDSRRRAMTRDFRTSIRTAARWAAAVALIALAGTVAAAGTGFASNVSELFKRTDGCSRAPLICTILRSAIPRS